jgi:hypothetical protein
MYRHRDRQKELDKCKDIIQTERIRQVYRQTDKQKELDRCKDIRTDRENSTSV